MPACHLLISAVSRPSGPVLCAVTLALALGLSACDAAPTGPAADDSGEFVISLNVSATPIATLAVLVTAPDIATPLAFNITQTNGTASGTIRIPPGDARTITIYAFSAAGDTTHAGAKTVDVRPGMNAPVSIPLVSRAGQQPIVVVMGPVAIALAGAATPLMVGELLQLTATVTAPNGEVVQDAVVWATTNPTVVIVGSNGVVTAIGSGTAQVVATYAGVAAAASFTVIAGFAQVSAGDGHSCAVMTDGAVHCWGTNGQGQLGDNTTTARSRASAPIQMAGLPLGTRFTRVAAGGGHSCALASSGDIYCWGFNAYGQLGNNSNNGQLTPVRVQSQAAFTAVTAGAHHTCALDSGGRAWCWGLGDHGQLGYGNNNAMAVPTPVAGGATFRAISASPGGFATCAVGMDFKVYCWGYNAYGQAGNLGTSDVFTPVAVSMQNPATKYVGVTAGGEHACALSDQGRVLCWGFNDNGELGTASVGGTANPGADVNFPGQFSAVSAGVHHTCALAGSGTLVCWGDGLASGNGTGVDTGDPTPINDDGTGVNAYIGLSAGASHTLVADAARRAFGWGTNPDGRVGNGTTADQPATNPLPRVLVR